MTEWSERARVVIDAETCTVEPGFPSGVLIAGTSGSVLLTGPEYDLRGVAEGILALLDDA